jgi:PAS domain S-box-containing protein
MQLPALVLDTHGTIAYANERLLRLTGWVAADVYGRSWFDFFLDQPCTDARLAFVDLLEGAPDVLIYLLDVRKRNGDHASIRWHNALVRDGDRVVGTASIGEVLRETIETTDEATPIHPTPGPLEVIALAHAVFDRPEAAAVAFIKLVAGHCAQLAAEWSEPAASHIRAEFCVEDASGTSARRH